MIKPLTLMKIINERSTFVKNHPDALPFFKENFNKNVESGTTLRVQFISPKGEESTFEIAVEESDLPLFKNWADVLNQLS